MATPASLPLGTAAGSISRPPTAGERTADWLTRTTTLVSAWAVIALVAYIVLTIGRTASPAVARFGPDLLTGTTWDTNRELFGLLPAIWGTLYSSVLGLAIGSFFGLAIAIVLSQDFLPPALETLLKNVIELLAAIPSVVYGLWGIFVLIPFLKTWVYPVLEAQLGFLPFFTGPIYGP